MKAGIVSVALFLLLLSSTSAAPAAVIHVPGDQPTIQAGLNAATNGDTVLVADGTYTGPDNRHLDFDGKSVVLRSANGPGTCIIDCQNSQRAAHFDQDEGPGAVIRGFTIRNGYTAQHGGGIICLGAASPRIEGNVITSCNSAENGGGIYCDVGSQALIAGNSIIGNTSHYAGGGIYCGDATVIGNTISYNTVQFGPGPQGGGIACYNGQTVIRKNTISYNTADGSYCSGAGIFIHTSASAVITGNTISVNKLQGPNGRGGGVSAHYQATASLVDNRITGNYGADADSVGGGVYLESNSIGVIFNNTISSNHTTYRGGGIWVGDSALALIFDNRVRDNATGIFGGGGIYLFYSDATLTNNLIDSNSAVFPAAGGGIYCEHCSPTITNNTITNNTAGGSGGGIYCNDFCSPTVVNSILYGNVGPLGAQIGLSFYSTLDILFSDVEGGQADASVSAGSTLNWGAGMINADPLFTGGPLGGRYLSQTAAGQSVNSPCVNTGDPSSWSPDGTTRSDSVQDSGMVDMGWHELMAGLVTGAGRGYENPPRVRVFPPEQGADPVHDFAAYGSSHYGVNVTCGDIDGDGRAELITGAGPGDIFGPHVRGFGMDGTPISYISFLAYGTNKYGVNVACGDIDGDARNEIITGAGPGAVFGPHVRAFYSRTTGVVPVPGVSYFAYGTLKWGVNVACGDIDGDGYDEIVTGAGPGAVFGPHVRGWNFDGLGAASAVPGVSFLAYGTNKFGVNVACGDVDNDGIDEIITAPGPSSVFSSHIRGWNHDGGSVSELPGFSFFAWAAAEAHYGAKIFVANIDESTRDELLVGAGPDPSVGSPVKVYSYHDPQVELLFSLDAFPGDYEYGAVVAAGLF